MTCPLLISVMEIVCGSKSLNTTPSTPYSSSGRYRILWGHVDLHKVPMTTLHLLKTDLNVVIRLCLQAPLPWWISVQSMRITHKNPLVKLPIVFDKNPFRSSYGADFSDADFAICDAEYSAQIPFRISDINLFCVVSALVNREQISPIE